MLIKSVFTVYTCKQAENKLLKLFECLAFIQLTVETCTSLKDFAVVSTHLGVSGDCIISVKYSRCAACCVFM